MAGDEASGEEEAESEEPFDAEADTDAGQSSFPPDPPAATPEPRPPQPPGPAQQPEAQQPDGVGAAPATPATAPRDAEDTAKYSAARPDGDTIDFIRTVVEQQVETHLKTGAVANGQNAQAFAVFTENVVIGSGERRVRIVKSIYRDSRVEEQVRDYVKPEGIESVARTLQDSNVVLLFGQQGKGRFTSALWLLTQLCPYDRIGRLGVAEDGDLMIALTEDGTPVLSERTGFIADLGTRPVRLSEIEALSALAKERTAYLVLLCPRNVPDPSLDQYAFVHRGPALEQVLFKRLQATLRRHVAVCSHAVRCTDQTVEAYADGLRANTLIRAQLAPGTPVREVADLAQSLAASVQDGVAVEDLVNRWRNRLRTMARNILGGADLQGRGRPEHPDPHRQAFRIAYAVFNGKPLENVFSSSLLLVRDIIPQYESRESTLPHLVFESLLDELLPEGMAVPYDGAAADSAVPRRAELSDANLTAALLEVAWHEYEALRNPLVNWLDELTADDDVTVGLHAAGTVGLLATFDFTAVYRRLIRHWARGNVLYRQAAAFALGQAFVRGAGERAAEQVRSWAQSPDWRLQDSAARSFGTAIGFDDPAAAIVTLRKLVAGPEMSVSSAPPIALGSLWLSGAAGHVFDALCSWCEDPAPGPGYQAARTLLILAGKKGDEEYAEWPAVAQRARDDERRTATLVRLWQIALADPRLVGRSWASFGRWLCLADGSNEELEKLLLDLGQRVFAERPLATRAPFYLRMWRKRNPKAVVPPKILRELS